ncbi:MAG: ATP-binding cassette domain-containing protein [Enterococcus sp.]
MNIKQLNKTINQTPILTNVNFTLPLGEIVGLIGRNGSGKTTLFRSLSGHYLLDSGDIRIQGTSLLSHEQLKNQLFYIDEKEHFLGSYSLKKIGIFYRTAYKTFNQDLFLELTHQHHLPLHSTYKKLSKGMQGLFQMILAICSNAPYLLLDEPFDGLDVIVRKQVIRLLLEHISTGKHCALIASHNLVELEGLIDRALILKDTTISKEYSLDEMRAQAKKLQLVFKTKHIPEQITANAKIMQRRGRVIVAVFENYTPELATEITALQPLLLEELPLSLEDLFEATLNQEAIY